MSMGPEGGEKQSIKTAMVTPTRFFMSAGAALAAIFALTALAAVGPQIGASLPGQPSSISVPYFLALFAMATALVLVLVRVMKSPTLVVLLLRVSLVMGAVLLGWRLFGELGAVFSVPLAVLLTSRKTPVWAVNLLVVIASAGVAAQIGGAMGPVAAAISISALAVYDLVAVFGTKHMVYLAKKLAGNQAVFAYTIPAGADGWAVGFDEVKPGSEFGFLGIGDLVMPSLLFAAVSGNVPYMVGVAVGTFIGLAVLSYVLLPKSKGFMPGLPPLVFGATAFLSLAMLFY